MVFLGVSFCHYVIKKIQVGNFLLGKLSGVSAKKKVPGWHRSLRVELANKLNKLKLAHNSFIANIAT